MKYDIKAKLSIKLIYEIVMIMLLFTISSTPVLSQMNEGYKVFLDAINKAGETGASGANEQTAQQYEYAASVALNMCLLEDAHYAYSRYFNLSEKGSCELSVKWEQIGDYILILTCQGTWGSASNAYLKAAEYKEKCGKDLLDFYSKTAEKYKAIERASGSEYVKSEASRYAALFLLKAGKPEEAYDYSINRLEYATQYYKDETIKEVLKNGFLEIKLSICSDQECKEKLLSSEPNKKLYISAKVIIGGAILDNEVNGYFTTPSGNKYKLSFIDNSAEFIPIEVGEHEIVLSSAVSTNRVIDKKTIFIVKDSSTCYKEIDSYCDQECVLPDPDCEEVGSFEIKKGMYISGYKDAIKKEFNNKVIVISIIVISGIIITVYLVRKIIKIRAAA